MNTHEGLRRIKLLGKLTMLLGTIVAVIYWLLTTFWLREPGSTSIAPFYLLVLVINPLLLGGAILVIVWIVEGFTKDKAKEP